MVLFWLLMSILSFWQWHEKLNSFESFDFYLMIVNAIVLLSWSASGMFGQMFIS